MTLCSDEEGDNEGWLNLSSCPCTSYTYGSEAGLKGPINQFLVESRALFTIRRNRTPYLLEEVGLGLASFPGLLRLQFLIACSMQKRREKAPASSYPPG